MRPGRLLHRLSIACSTATRERVLEPLLADLQHEWADRRDVPSLLSGYIAFWAALALCSTRAALAEARRPPSTDLAVHAAVGFGVAVAAAAIVETAILYALTAARPLLAPELGLRPFLLIDQARALALAVPLATLPALLYGRSRADHPRAADAAKLIVIGVALSVAVTGWITPWAMRRQTLAAIGITQAIEARHDRDGTWDEGSAERALRRSGRLPPEPSPEALVGSMPSGKSWPALLLATSRSSGRWRLAYARDVNHRASLLALTIALGLLGWSLGGLSRDRAAHATMWWSVAWLLMFALQRRGGADLVRMNRAWVPVVVFGLAAIALNVLNRTAARDWRA